MVENTQDFLATPLDYYRSLSEYSLWVSCRHLSSDRGNVAVRPEAAFRAMVVEHIVVAEAQPMALLLRDRIVTPLTEIKTSSARIAEDL